MTDITMSAVSNYTQSPNFKSRTQPQLINIERYPNYEVKTYETNATSGKKWGVGIASSLLTGLGQAINGDWGKGIGFFFGQCALGGATGFCFGMKKPAAGAGCLLGALGIKIWSIVDAVKSAKSETAQVIPLNQNNNKEWGI